jgi:hypothetical protein
MKRKAKEEMIQTTMRLPKPLWEAVTELAFLERMSMQQVTERALAHYCSSYEGMTRSMFDNLESFAQLSRLAKPPAIAVMGTDERVFRSEKGKS